MFKAHHTRYSVEKTVSAVQEDPVRESIMKVWKEYIIVAAINVIGRAMKTVKP